MYSDEQIKIAETFLGTAVNSGVLSEEVCKEMVDKLKSQEDILLTYKEVEATLKVSRSTVERYLRNGDLKGGKHKGLVRFSKASVDALKKKMLSDDEEERVL